MTPVNILVGDPENVLASTTFPIKDNTKILFVNTRDQFIEEAYTHNYEILVSERDFGCYYDEGINLMKEIKDIPGRKIIWTSRVDSYLINASYELGIEILEKER